MTARVRLERLGRVDYLRAWRWQRAAADAVRARDQRETLALLEHPPVYTLGRRADERHVLSPTDLLAARGATVQRIDRGGDVTFHGPGQLVGYPILDLRARGMRATEYVRALEQVLIDTAATFGVAARRVPRRVGIWTDVERPEKLAAIGVRVARGVSMHGFALNVDVDLGWFDHIVPCGITDAGVTSLAAILGEAPPMQAVEDAVATAFAEVFACELDGSNAHNGEPMEPALVGATR